MKRMKSSSAAALSMSKVTLMGTVTCIMLLIIQSAIAAILISNENIDLGISSYLAGIMQFIAIFAGSVFAGKLLKEKKGTGCAIVAGGCIFIQCAVAILFFDGISAGFASIILASIAGSGAAILLCIGNKNRSINNKRRTRSR